MINYDKLNERPIYDQPRPKETTSGGRMYSYILFGMLIYMVFFQNMSFSVGFQDRDWLRSEKKEILANVNEVAPVLVKEERQTIPAPQAEKVVASMVPTFVKSESKVVKKEFKTKNVVKWKAEDFNNLSFIFDGSLAQRKGVSNEIVEMKLDHCRKYIERFAKVAIAEHAKYNIPASITLAQGLLETNAGDSRLANESNNHFGIKCKAKCKDCTCRNYKDDDEFDMFRVFESAWYSYREHSKLLSSARYKHLTKLSAKDYKKWAEGLQKAGYATDKRYAKKLVRIIESLDLYQFDKVNG